MSFEDNLNKILERYNELSLKLTGNLPTEAFIKASKEYAELEPLVEKIKHFHSKKDEQKGLAEYLNSEDEELKKFAQEENLKLNDEIPLIERSIKLALLPQDEADAKNAIIEVRAGTGGEEAALFAQDLFRMYQRYCDHKRWKFEILSLSEAERGGFKEASGIIRGKGVFARLKFESGVHRVQRVPDTESSGRIHTSAATVAVLPEAEDVDIKIEEKDLRIDTFRSSGAGGQHVNTTDSAVRITHIPTGLAVAQQDEKSQHKNKAKAMKLLMSRLYDMERQKRDSERAENRKSQIGSGDRSERIRTYNYPQSRVTDHRINLTSYNIDDVMDGSGLEEFLDALIADDEACRLAESPLKD